MKLSEAMTIQYDICVEIIELGNEYKICSLIHPGETPQKDAGEILECLQTKYAELARIEDKINCTNKSCGINRLIVKRDQKKRQYRLIKMGYRAAFDRRRTNNNKFRFHKDLSILRDKINDALAEYRKYDIMIQKLNQTTELIET